MILYFFVSFKVYTHTKILNLSPINKTDQDKRDRHFNDDFKLKFSFKKDENFMIFISLDLLVGMINQIIDYHQ